MELILKNALLRALPKCKCGKHATFYDIHFVPAEDEFFVKDYFCSDCRSCEVFENPKSKEARMIGENRISGND